MENHNAYSSNIQMVDDILAQTKLSKVPSSVNNSEFVHKSEFSKSSFKHDTGRSVNELTLTDKSNTKLTSLINQVKDTGSRNQPKMGSLSLNKNLYNEDRQYMWYVLVLN